MKENTEIIVLAVVLILIYTRPSTLVKFSSSLIGKLIFIVAIVLSSLISPLLGLLIATMMVLFMEQNYEGFVEGNVTALITGKIVGDYSDGATQITITTDSITTTNENINALINNPTKYDFKYNSDNYIIKSVEKTSTFVLIDDTLITDTKASGIECQIYEEDDTTQVVGSVETMYQNIGTASKGIKNITTSMIDSSITIDSDKNYIIQIDGSNYTIDTINESYTILLNAGLDGVVTNDYIINIFEHSHTHSHEGFDGNPKKDKITKEGFKEGATVLEDSTHQKKTNSDVSNSGSPETMNLSISLDPEGVGPFAKALKKAYKENIENFCGGRNKKANGVLGAYASESYEAEITGESVCTSPLCERIHREEQLTRPVNSNEEVPRF